MAVTRTRGRLAIASSVEVVEKLRGSTESLPAQVSLGSYEDEVFVREGVQFGPSLPRSAGCDALIAWRYSVQLQKSVLMLLILRFDGGRGRIGVPGGARSSQGANRLVN